MSDLPSPSTPPSPADTSAPVRWGGDIEELKAHMNEQQKAIRKARYARQLFIPLGITWQGILLSDRVDQEIAAQLQLPFEIREINLRDENEARLWILERVLENPHLNAFQRVRANLQRKTLLLAQGRQRMATAGQGLTEVSNPKSHNTRVEIAKASGSSQGQVHKVETLLEHADTVVLQQLEDGVLKIGAAFGELRQPPMTHDQTEQYSVIYVAAPADTDAKKLRALQVRHQHHAMLVGNDRALRAKSRGGSLFVTWVGRITLVDGTVNCPIALGCSGRPLHIVRR